jgi:hypothetical protein
LSWLAACFVFLRRFAAGGQWGWVAACIAAPVAVIVVDAWPDLDSLSIRLVIGSAISFAFVASIAAGLIAQSQRRDLLEVGSGGSVPTPSCLHHLLFPLGMVRRIYQIHQRYWPRSGFR